MSTEVVDLGRLDLGEDVHEVGAVAQITIVKFKLVRSWISSICGCERVKMAEYEWKRTFVLVGIHVL